MQIALLSEKYFRQMTRFNKFIVDQTNLVENARNEILQHFGTNSIEVNATFPRWQNKIVLVISTDKSDEYLKIMTDGTHSKLNDGDSAASMDGTHPIVIVDPKYKLLNFNPGIPLNHVNCLRIALLKSNSTPSSNSVKQMTLVKLNLDRPTQNDVSRLTSEVEANKLKDVLEAWPESFKTNLSLPKFVKEQKPTISPPNAPQQTNPSAPPAASFESDYHTPNGDNTKSVLIQQDESTNHQLAVLADAILAIEDRIKSIDLNSGRNALLVQNNPSSSTSPTDSSKVVLSKTVFTVPRVDIENEDGMAEAADSLLNMARLVDVKSHKNIILQFLTTNGLTDIIADLTDEQLSNIRQFHQAMLTRYGSPDAVASFNLITQKNLEDPSALLNRIERAWRRVKSIDVDAPIPVDEIPIIRNRYIKSIRDKELRTKLRIWDTPYKDLVRVTRDFNNAMKIENNSGGANNESMMAFDGCKHCGLAHASDTCRSNAKQKTQWNKRQKSNRPISRSPARIIPDNLGHDNHFQPTQRNMKISYSNRRPLREMKQVRFQGVKQRPGRNNWISNNSKRSDDWSNGRKQRTRAKYFNRRSTQAYLAMDEYEDDFEYPFSGVETESNSKFD